MMSIRFAANDDGTVFTRLVTGSAVEDGFVAAASVAPEAAKAEVLRLRALGHEVTLAPSVARALGLPRAIGGAS